MKIISTGYSHTGEYKDPHRWLQRISFYTGILEELAKHHLVESIEQINYSGEHEQQGVKYHFLNKKVYGSFINLNHFIKRLQPDVVMVNGFIFPLQVLHLRWVLGRRVKLIVMHRAEKPAKGYKRLLQRLAGNRIDAYIFSSQEMGMEWVKAGIIRNRRKIVEAVQASSVFKPAARDAACAVTGAKGDPIFLWVGRLDENKDPLTVVKAFSRFAKEQPGTMLYMVYHTKELLAELEELILKTGSTHAIHLVGKVEHAALQHWYNSADYMVSGSHYEGSGIAVCEGMSCGCIPVVTNIHSFRSMTGGSKCGLLYEPGNEEALLTALQRTKEMDMQLEKANTLQQFKARLSFEAIAGKLVHAITSVNRS